MIGPSTNIRRKHRDLLQRLKSSTRARSRGCDVFGLRRQNERSFAALGSPLEPEEDFRHTVGAGDGVAGPLESALLENADRSQVLHGNVRVKRARRFVLQELRERRGGDAPAPVLLSHPITNEALATLLPADDVPGHAAADENR